MTIQIEQRDLLACVSLPSLSALQTHRVCGIRLDECGLNRNYVVCVCVCVGVCVCVCVCGLSGLTQNRSTPALTYLVYLGLKKDFVWNGQQRSVCTSMCVCVFVCACLSYPGMEPFCTAWSWGRRIICISMNHHKIRNRHARGQRHNDTQTPIHWLTRNMIHNIPQQPSVWPIGKSPRWTFSL